jgi:hypothetical protein
LRVGPWTPPPEKVERIRDLAEREKGEIPQPRVLAVAAWGPHREGEGIDPRGCAGTRAQGVGLPDLGQRTTTPLRWAPPCGPPSPSSSSSSTFLGLLEPTPFSMGTLGVEHGNGHPAEMAVAASFTMAAVMATTELGHEGVGDHRARTLGRQTNERQKWVSFPLRSISMSPHPPALK